MRQITAKRIAVVIVCCALVYLSFISAVAGVTRDFNPELALRFAPHDADALGNKAYAMTLKGQTMKNGLEIEALAKQSILGSPIITRPYFALLGAWEAAQRTADINRLASPVSTLSRRDAALQLWFLERAAARDQLATVLVHYDNLLRAHPELNDLLFERLTAGLSEPEIRKALQPYVARRAGWVSDLVRYALSDGNSPAGASVFVLDSGGISKFIDSDTIGRTLVDALVSAGEIDKARAIYLQTPMASPVALTAVDLRPETTGGIQPISWEMRSEGETYTTLSEVEGGKQRIVVQLSAESNAIFARKLVILTPGRYKLTLKARASEPGAIEDFTVRPVLFCFKRSGEHEVLDEHDILAKGPEADSWIAEVVANCPAQILQLKAAAGPQTSSPILIESPVLSRIQ